jgi:hypothetical protein
MDFTTTGLLQTTAVVVAITTWLIVLLSGRHCGT